uniref:Phosphodiesterase n=1 Tax=Cycas revoluta TaxID=3396 RepID=A0A8D5G5V6_CYCRE|nr:bifunctional adenylyl cyclase/cAMP phosphodiesterase [Cycas revoluta]
METRICTNPMHTLPEEEDEIDCSNGCIQPSFDGIKFLSFDIFEVLDEDLPKMVERIFEDLGLFDIFSLDRQKFRAFVDSMSAQYRATVPYHNFRHACDVIHAIYLLLTCAEAGKLLNDLEKLALVMAGLCHDVDHPGLTNTFLVYCNDPLAIRYNNISVLENHHASIAVKTLLDYKSMNVLSSLTEAEQRHVRKLMVALILATDMARHEEFIDSFKERLNDPKPFECSSPYISQREDFDCAIQGAQMKNSGSTSVPVSTKDVLLLMKMLIKCADTSNIMKPFSLSKRWAALLLTEWFRQGDLEKRLGMPVSKHMDREDSSALQSMNLGFLESVGKPMFEMMAELLPKLQDEVLPTLWANRSEWTCFNSMGSSEKVVEEILRTFDSGLEFENRDGGVCTKMETQAIARRSINGGNCMPGRRSFVSINSRERKDRPLSLLLGGPMELHAFCEANKAVPISESLTKRNSSSKPNLLLSKVNGSLTISPAVTERTRYSFGFGSFYRSSEDRASILHHIAERNSIDLFSKFQPSFWKTARSNPYAVKCNRALDSTVWQCVIVPISCIAIFADDLVKAAFPKYIDSYAAKIYLVCLALFLLELIMLSLVRNHYFASISFWLDLLGSLSLVPFIMGATQVNLIIARSIKTAKTFTRAAKWMQNGDYLKLFRLANVMRMVRCRNSASSDDDEEETVPDPDHHCQGKPSQVWTRLSELTSQKLVIGMLIIVVVVPLVHTDISDVGPVTSLESLDHQPLYSLYFNSSLNKILQFYKLHKYELLYLGVRDGCLPPEYISLEYCSVTNMSSTCQGVDEGGTTYHQVVPEEKERMNAKEDAEEKYRITELLKVTSNSKRSEAYFSVKKETQIYHAYDLALTIIILLILSAWSFFLSWDSNKLLIQPIERMVNFVKELADDPVSFAGKVLPQQGDGKVMETRFIEAALIKIASLTKVALGDAGMDILSVNLKGTEFNPMIPGKKVRACYGFCDIRNFTDATECLQEEVMMFVNRIADLIHNKVIMHHGFPNKNIGDAFLIVWKKTLSDAASKHFVQSGTSFADRALRSFLDIIHSVETSKALQEFAMHPSIQKRMPGYRIRLGFGLHVGWAIEGAIGSSHKVDPSYLSPHVNMASRLEAATKQYGVTLLISETVIANLTKSSLRDSCRKLDRVTVKGSAAPLTLYTYDMPSFQKDLKGNPQDYKNLFEAAVDDYIVGNWHESCDKLKECARLWPSDKPASILLDFMASHRNIVPSNWKGYRELTEK